MCTINKSAHTKKSGNLLNDPRTYYCNRTDRFSFAEKSNILTNNSKIVNRNKRISYKSSKLSVFKLNN